MKKIIFAVGCAISLISCDDNMKITPYLKPKKELRFDFSVENFIIDINFLFIIDTSKSMKEFNDKLSENIDLFLNSVFTKYPNYNYNFAITTMTPRKKYNKGQFPLFFDKDSFLKCRASKDLHLKESNLGSYLQYSHRFSNEMNLTQLLCVLGLNIKEAEGYDSGIESYFQSFDYILDHADLKFKTDFFGRGKKIILFFISDSWEGVDYAKMMENKKTAIQYAANNISDHYFDKINRLMSNNQNDIKSYAVVPDNKKFDKCGTESVGDSSEKYPFHLYQFVEKTNGLIVSICDQNWGENLQQVSVDFLSSFSFSEFYLDEFPNLNTINVYLNDREVPNDVKKGWFFNPENLSINIGEELDLSYYIDSIEEGEIKVEYYPLNMDIFRKKLIYEED